MNRKVWIISEVTEDICIGTVGQVLEATSKLRTLQTAIKETVRYMIDDECFDDDSVSFTIEIRN